MARPRKEGMDYFPHDVNAANDKKIEALRMIHGNNGYAFYFIILEIIYQEPNFELDVSDAETMQILAKKVAVTEQEFKNILETAIKRGCFDKEAYEKRHVLTSNGIKKRANVVVEKRVKMRVKRVSDAETTEEITPVTPQRKGKESKGKESKVKESKEVIKTLYGDFVQMTSNQYESLVNDLGLDVTQKYIASIDDWFAQDNNRLKKYSDHARMVRTWKRNDDNRAPTLQFTPPKGKISSFEKLQQMAREEADREASGYY